MRTKIFITGSSGSLGRILVNTFDKKGMDVTGIDIRNSFPVEKYKSFRYYQVDIKDREALAELFRKEKPSHVFHLACSYNTIRNRQLEYENDVAGSQNVFDIANETPSVKQLIYFSSATAYGVVKRNSRPLTEEDPLRPGKYRYGKNKKMIEDSLASMEMRPGLQKIILRICTTVGPSYDKDASVVSILIKFPYMLKISKRNILQFLHEEDLADIVEKIINDDEIEGAYNIAPDEPVLVRSLVPRKKYVDVPYWFLQLIISLLWNTRLLNLQPAGLPYSFRPVVIDPSKIMKRYNYRFKYTSKQAFEETRKKNMLDPKKKY